MPEGEETAVATEMEPPFEEDAVSEGDDKSATDSMADLPQEEEEKKEGTPKDGDGIAGTSQVAKEDFSKYKTKVAYRLAKALEEMPTDSAYRSPDLVPLATDFQTMRKKLRSLITSAKAYQAATLKVQDARSKLYEEYAILSKDTPIYDYVGKELDQDALMALNDSGNGKSNATAEELELQAKSALKLNDQGVPSLASIQQLATLHEKTNAVDYQRHILDYITEWEEVVTTKIESELAMVKKLQQDRLHYEKKVEGLRKKAVQAENKGKKLSTSQEDKLNRNEKKLKDAWQLHEQKAAEACFLIEQVTLHGWKDFYPLVKNTMKWEVNRLGRENVTYGRLPATLEAMKASYVAQTETEQN